MSEILVDTCQRRLRFAELDLACTIGKGGAVAAEAKREGDGATPLGLWPVRCVLLRPDRPLRNLRLRLPRRWIRPDDGWSDGASDPAYNRPVRHPHAYSAERLWREDAAYDAIVVLGHNDAPPVPGMGSAIFFHVAPPGRDFTEGCVAIAGTDMEALLPRLAPGDMMRIV